MNPKLISLLTFLGLVFSSAYLTSCIPNVARTDARITPGWSVGGAAGYSATLDTPKKVSSGSDSDEKTKSLAGEFNLQYGQRKEGDFGYAIQLKMPLFFLATALDTYVQLPSPKGLNYGLGAELSAFYPALYGVVTVDLTSKYALSTTFRTMYTVFTTSSSLPKTWLLNPQLALISKYEDFKLSLFGSYMYGMGEGIYEVSSFAWTTDAADYSAKQFIYAGLAVSF